MLESEPPQKLEMAIGCTKEVLTAWQRMGPLKLEKIAQDAILTFDSTVTAYREWIDDQDS